MDSFLGNFADFPFDLLAGVSFVTGDSIQTDALFLRGQFTAWNMDDKDLRTAWKKFPSLRTPEHYTKQLEGDMAEHSDEGYWSKGFVRSNGNEPGSNLSWIMLPNLLGDDTYDGDWMKKNSTQAYVISGRDILLTASNLTREETEQLILSERQRQAEQTTRSWQMGELIEEVIAADSCSEPHRWRHTCIPMPEGTQPYPPRYEISLTQRKGQEPGQVSVHLKEIDWKAPYQRKMIKHHLFSKKKSWFTFPPFVITTSMILRYNADFMEVFEIGADREVTLYGWNR